MKVAASRTRACRRTPFATTPLDSRRAPNENIARTLTEARVSSNRRDSKATASSPVRQIPILGEIRGDGVVHLYEDTDPEVFEISDEALQAFLDWREARLA